MKSIDEFPRKTKVYWTFCGLLFLWFSLSLLGCGGSDSTGEGVLKYQHPNELAKVQEAIQREGAQWIV